jgi:hypothetical protein
MKIAQFSKHPDLVIMLYGSGASTNCADFYVSVASNAYILVGHDLDVIPIVGVYWKEQDGRPIISLNRSESNGVTKTGYSFELIDEYTLQRNLSTFVSPR